jgi:hypothetical protein
VYDFPEDLECLHSFCERPEFPEECPLEIDDVPVGRRLFLQAADVARGRMFYSGEPFYERGMEFGLPGRQAE